MLPALTLLLPALLFAEDCVPTFYTSLPRDREWYYGAAKDKDNDKARDGALKNLGKQVTGDVEGWNASQVEELAGPGQDRWEVAKKVGALLPQSTLLAGWEQDDHELCKGRHYVLVRVEKERVRAFIKENRKFQHDLLGSLSARVEKAEQRLTKNEEATEKLKERLAKLEEKLGAFDQKAAENPSTIPKDPVRVELAQKIEEIETDLAAGVPPAQIERKLSEVEELSDKFTKAMTGLFRDFDREHAEAEAAFKEPQLNAALERVRAGPITYKDVSDISAFYTRNEKNHELHAFSHEVLAALPYQKGLPYYEDPRATASHNAFLAATNLEPEELLKDAESFLLEYKKVAPDWIADFAKVVAKSTRKKLKKKR